MSARRQTGNVHITAMNQEGVVSILIHRVMGAVVSLIPAPPGVRIVIKDVWRGATNRLKKYLKMMTDCYNN
jgi:hypothetical protein